MRTTASLAPGLGDERIGRGRRRVGPIGRVFAGVAAIVVLWIVVRPVIAQPLQWQWDFSVYYNAAAAVEQGRDPYGDLPQALDFQPPLRFVYPPLMLVALKPLTALDYVTASRVYLTLKLIALVALLRLWTKHFLPEATDTAFALFALLAIGGALSVDILSGNVSTFEQVAVWWGFWLLLRGRLAAFCVCIAAASLFKLAPILFLAALLISPSPQRFRYLLGFAGLFVLAIAAQYLVAPDWFASFIRNVSSIQETGSRGNPSAFAFAQDAFDWLRPHTGMQLPAWTATVSWAGFTTAILWLTTRAFRGSRLDGTRDDVARIGLLCATTALALPRLKNYSYAVLLVPAWTAIAAVSVHRVVRGACAVGVCLSNAYPVVRFFGALGVFIAPRARGWWFLPLAQTLFVWVVLMAAVRRTSATANSTPRPAMIPGMKTPT